MRALKYLAGFALVLAAAVFLAGGVASAQTSAVNCGDFVNGNVSLNHDLVCPSTDGLIVDSPNTTIHLNGHKITCPNDALPCWEDEDSGIYTEYNNTQVVGPGTVQGFFSNISLFSSANTVKSLNTAWGASHASAYGVYVDGSSNFVQHVTDTGSDFSICSCSFGFSNGFDNNNSNLAGQGDELEGHDGDDGGGIVVFGDSGDIVHGNVVSHALGENYTDDEENIGGISLIFADHTLVQGNKVDHTTAGPGFADVCSTFSAYLGNTATLNYYDGIGIYHSNCGAEVAPPGAPIHASFPFDHYAGLEVLAVGNTANKNGYDGLYLEKADASEDTGNGSTVTQNKLNGNGIVFGTDSGFGGNGIDSYRTYASHIFHNQTNSNVGSGMAFYNPAADGINGNTSNQNHEDGLTIYYDFTCEISGPFGACDPLFVNYNTLTHNHEFGGFANDIVASIGNVANNNGTSPVDCVNINCVAHAAAGLAPSMAAKTAGLSKAVAAGTAGRSAKSAVHPFAAPAHP